jgi:hypothetical protein
MKKIKFILIVSCIASVSFCYGQYRNNNIAAQSPVTPVKVGSVIINVGAGIGTEYNNDYYNSPFGTKLAIEWGLWQAGPGVITLGGEVGASYTHGGYYTDYRAQTTVVASRAAWHYGWKVRGLDTYGGFSMGAGFNHYQYNNVNNDGRDYSGNNSIFVVGGFVGASYFVTPRFGFNAEAGHDITDFQVGVIFKVK